MPSTLATPEIEEINKPTFKIFSNALKAFEKDVDGVQRKFLACTASSTITDLHGDRMTEDCVQGMAPQAKAKGMTIFLNHSYDVPEDVFGRTMDAKVVQRSHNSDGTPIWDLDLEVMLDESNERAINTYRSIKEQGIKLGVSIGAMIEDYAFIDEEDGWWGGLEIKSVDLLEASIVGIPANQRSWVVNGIEALGAPRQVVRKAAGLSYKKDALMNTDPDPEPEPEPTPEPEQKDIDPPVQDAAGCGDCQPGEPCDMHKDATPDVEASAAPAEETPAEGEDPSSEPVTEEAEVSAEAAADAVASLMSAGADAALLEIVLSFLEGATEEVASLREQVKSIEAERDEARQDVQRATEVIETIAKTPLGRKARFSGPVTSFRARFAGYYDEDFLKFLDAGDDTDE